MDKVNYTILCAIILLFICHLSGTFSPDQTDFDAYGLKIAMNDIILVKAQNNPATFFIQFAPYNNTQTSPQCSIDFPDTYHYVYSVAVGTNAVNNQAQFFFAGELFNNKSGTFVGIVTLNYTNIVSNMNNNTVNLCDSSYSYSVQYFYNYDHQEYYILGVEPNGRFAYGFSNSFVFIFDSQNTSTLELWNGSLIWPDNSFMPHAIDTSDNFCVIAGFFHNSTNVRVKYSPMIYLIRFNSSNHYPIVIDQYQTIATPGSWQDLLTNSDAYDYSAKYDMSVSITNNGYVLVGMQFRNKVFLFSVNVANPTTLIFVNRNTMGRSIGNGKGVAWLDNGNTAAILVNTYSLDYKWSSSLIYVYDISGFYNSTSIPISVFPNYHQTLPQSFSPIFLNIVLSSGTLALLGDAGDILIFNPALPGYYASPQDTRTMLLITSQQPCAPGTYKNQSGIDDCALCPTGTKNPGTFTTNCIPCLQGSFCQLGSVSDVPMSALRTTTQVIAYPVSPDSTIFDEILIQNMFSIGPGRCALISPLFWSWIVLAVGTVITIIVGILKFFEKNSKALGIRKLVKSIFQKTDLINEGELWIGGLVSFSIVVMVSFAYSFSHGYLKQYPIEGSSDSNFACDVTIRNAKFDTSLQSLGIPRGEAEQPMFDLLTGQQFTLYVDFINTQISCDAVSLQALFDAEWTSIRWLTCTNINSILSLSISLAFQLISVQVLIADTRTIGGLRIGLYGNQDQHDSYTLKELNFSQAFSKNASVLAQNLPVTVELTKVINQTLPMQDEESQFSGIYTSSFPFDLNSLFLSSGQYIFSSLQSTTLSIVISETTYYVKNVQQPITKLAEVIFHVLLFTIVCLEIYGLIFLIYKLVLQPIYRLIKNKFSKKPGKKDKKKNETNGDVRLDDISSSKNVDERYMTYAF